MKWKTSTIVLILAASLGVSGFFYYNKVSTVNSLEGQIDQNIQKGLTLEKEKLQSAFDKKVKLYKDSLTMYRDTFYRREQEYQDSIFELRIEIDNLYSKIDSIKNGGEIEQYRADIISKSQRFFSKHKIKRGAILKHNKSKTILHVKMISEEVYDDYIDVQVNLNFENGESKEHQLTIGKYFYIWNPREDELNKLLVTSINDKYIQLEWTYYKVKS